MIKAGTVLHGKYLVEKELNQGGTSLIYKCFHKALKISVALKKLGNINSQAISYRHEVDILKRLQHPMLPRVYDVFKYGEDNYIVIDFIDGDSLQEIINNKGIFTEESVIYLAYDLVNVLSYIHKKRIVHSDIKPANIMVCESGQLKLIDFGIATLTKNAKPLGKSRGFSAPEQRSKTNIDIRADIYSIGATLFYLLTGEIANDNNLNLKKASKGLAYIIKKCLHTDPKKRYQSVDEIYADLLRIKKLKTSITKKLNCKIAFVILYFIFGVCMILGIFINKRETAITYQEKIDLGIIYEQNKNFQAAEKLYYEAIDITKENATAYYLIANTLYNQKQYKECIELIEFNLDSKPINKKSSDYANLISLLASSYQELNNNTQAYIHFKEALQYEKSNIVLYYNFSIVAVNINKYDEANKALIKALKLNPETGLTNLLLGELAMLSKDYDEAKTKFNKAISTISDNNLKVRAYLQLAEAYRTNPDEIDQEIKVLTKAIQYCVISNKYIILEQLAETYYRKAITEQDTNYLLKASECYEQLIFSNIKDFYIYDNLCNLYQQLTQYDKAENILSDMMNLFSNDYRVLKRECFLEIAKQNNLPPDKRGYESLLETYNQLKKELNETNTVDLEINILEIKVSEILASLN